MDLFFVFLLLGVLGLILFGFVVYLAVLTALRKVFAEERAREEVRK